MRRQRTCASANWAATASARRELGSSQMSSIDPTGAPRERHRPRRSRSAHLPEPAVPGAAARHEPRRLGLRPAAARAHHLPRPAGRRRIANQICAQLLLLAAEDPKRDIHLYINSPGGSVTAGMAIYDTMQFIEPDVATFAMGLAASMGQFLLSAGERASATPLPHARIMMHQPSAGIGGTAVRHRDPGRAVC